MACAFCSIQFCFLFKSPYEREEKKNLFESSKNTITIDNIIQQLITESGCQKNILVNYAGHLNIISVLIL